MKPTSKTPYEIRLELLQLAQTMLDAKHRAMAGTQPPSTAPTAEDVIAEAEKLNAFVSKANSSH